MEQISSIKTDNTYKITWRKTLRAAMAELRVHQKSAIISWLLYLAAMVLFIFNTEIFTYITNDTEDPSIVIDHVIFEPSVTGVIFAALGIVTAFTTTISLFRDMNNQQFCDVSMALPIKATERYFSKLIVLFLTQIAPLCVSYFGGNGIALLYCRLRYGAPDPIWNELLEVFFAGLSLCMFVIAVCVLCTCCCGSPAESGYFSVLLMIVSAMLPIAFYVNIVNGNTGFRLWDITETGIDLHYWGPLALFVEEEEMIQHCLVSTAVSLVIIMLVLFIYKKRDARSVGTPIASKLFFEIMMTAGCFSLFSTFVMNYYAHWGIFIAAVAYLIINIIVSRAKLSLVGLLKWVGKFALTTAVFLAIVIASIKTVGFGSGNARPDTEYLDNTHFYLEYYLLSEARQVAVESKQLTAEQADIALDIIIRHCTNGRRSVNCFDVMFEHYNYSRVCSLRISGSGNIFFEDRPSPRIQFPFSYSNINSGYHFSYGRDVIMPISNAEALFDELLALDFFEEHVFDEHRYDDYVYID